jgi:hypothetical protein
MHVRADASVHTPNKRSAQVATRIAGSAAAVEEGGAAAIPTRLVSVSIAVAVATTRRERRL